MDPQGKSMEQFRLIAYVIRIASIQPLIAIAVGYPSKEEWAMSWATGYIAKLAEGETVSFRPRGNSMQGRIESGQLCTVAPITEDTKLSKGDIVLCKVKGNQYIHLIKAVQGERYQIGNNKGYINGWIGLNTIYGKLIKVET